ncbi:MAG: RsmE family RNA methyltransferase [Pseudobacter sp.]|uniref:RsmE family RNA methyltransferase n=1 Tax=Pseudobacter sp. TaxID=2045420 RepID=UPI003F808E1F
MSLPIFFYPEPASVNELVQLPEETSKHIVQVLRMDAGEHLQLADGKGNQHLVIIAEPHKKKCIVKVLSTTTVPAPARKISIAISLLKNASRFEWFMEKATEIGVSAIIPLICDRTEKQHFKKERFENILVSAMMQSQQGWLPVLHQPLQYEQLFRMEDTILAKQKFIAHCEENRKESLRSAVDFHQSSQLILIGPEGDFTPLEIKLALDHHFTPVTLGDTRLRAETAGVVAATLLCIH